MKIRLAVLLTLLVAGSDSYLRAQGNATAWTSGEYRYDGAGNVVAIGTAGAPGTQGHRTYGYDAVMRLTRANAGLSSTTYEYEYDVYGNRTAYSVNQQRVTVPVVPAANRLSDATYDAVGNQLARGATAATFDGFGMMTAYRFDAANAEAFVYTAWDERIGVLRGDEWTWSMRDPGGRVLRQYRSSAADPSAPWLWVEDFVYRGNLLLGSERVLAAGGRRHYHLDHLGSPRLVTSGAGSMISEHDFLPFGEERTPLGQQRARGFDREEPHRFTGHERDFDTASPNSSSAYVDYMHARYYAATTARFLSVDPGGVDIHRPQSWNRYSYVLNNPVNLVDPTGRCVWDICIGESALAWAGATALAATATAYLASESRSHPRRTNAQVVASSIEGGFAALGGLISLSEAPNKTVDDLLAEARPGRETKGKSKLYDLDGDYDDAVGDFNDLVKTGSAVDYGEGVLIGRLPDGRIVIVRPSSSDGAPTIEIQDGKKRIKFRYRDDEEEPPPGHDADAPPGTQ